MKLSVLALLTGIAMYAVGLGGCSQQEEAAAALAPDFTLTRVDGAPLRLSDLRGQKAVVLEFFATWCPVCADTVADVKRLVSTCKGANLAFYAISVDKRRSDLEGWIKQHDVDYPVLLDTDGKVAQAYDVVAVPLFVGISPAGTVVYHEHRLPKDLDAFVRLLKTGTAPPGK